MSETRLAVNFSPQAATLVEAGDIVVDLYKVPDWDDLIAAARELLPVYVHFPNQIGAAREKPDVARAIPLMRETGTHRFNVHAAPSRERFPDIEVGAHDPASLALVARALTEDLEPAIGAFGSDVTIIELL